MLRRLFAITSSSDLAPRLAWLLLPALLVLSQIASASHLMLAVGEDRPPYIMAGGKRGLELAVLKEAFAYKGHTFESFQVSSRRLNQVLIGDGTDAAAGVQESPNGAYYSLPFIAYRYVALSKQKQQLTINKMDELLAISVVTSQNTYQQLGVDFASLYAPARRQNDPIPARYLELPNPIQAVKMFWQDRADVIIIELNVFKALTSELDNNFNTSDALVVHPIFPAAAQFQVSFKDEQLRNDFNAGLAILHSSGRYRELVSRYLK
ncbi:transporter substrate-binding domain-containing protein [Corallincola luteus]|uniref:Transporter substrate-binding domain-containing protein n=1 Tax=Corallincola luteus TaxID=1775177 RepID=A0ABY2APE8_9GAMM|nr:transporter substrate-binding domain-containing protein [Corallincola luteus]TCI04816.1 transporter substrate-binding domain-containing protein [Corallincola luteus]